MTFSVVTVCLLALILLVLSRILWLVKDLHWMAKDEYEQFQRVDYDVRDIHAAVGAKRSQYRDAKNVIEDRWPV